MRKEIITSWIIGILLVSVIAFAGYQKKRENDQRYLTPEEKVHLKEQKFHRELGELKGQIELLSQQDSTNQKNLESIIQNLGELSGIVDSMKIYFEQYSPDNFESELRNSHNELAAKVAELASAIDSSKSLALEANREANSLRSSVAELDGILNYNKNNIKSNESKIEELNVKANDIIIKTDKMSSDLEELKGKLLTSNQTFDPNEIPTFFLIETSQHAQPD